LCKDLDEEIVYEEECSFVSSGKQEGAHMEEPVRVYMEADM
jgi:hypothetical protein